MKKILSYFGGYFGTCIVLLVAGFLCLLLANWIPFMQWPGFVFLGLLSILVVCGIIYVWIIRPLMNLFKDEDE